MDVIRGNVLRVQKSMAAAAERAERRPDSVGIVAATKYVPGEVIRALYAAGLRDFAENTIQKLSLKTEELRDLTDIRWHMIGHLQRNKVARALQLVRSIHSVDSLRLLREIHAQALKRELPMPKLYVEVNVSEEPQKTGLPPEELPDLLRQFRSDVREASEGESGSEGITGLMTMPPHSEQPEDSRPYFCRLRKLRDDCAALGLLSPTAGLSMGMSADFPIAIEEGATVVRVGSTLFEGMSEPA